MIPYKVNLYDNEHVVIILSYDKNPFITTETIKEGILFDPNDVITLENFVLGKFTIIDSLFRPVKSKPKIKIINCVELSKV